MFPPRPSLDPWGSRAKRVNLGSLTRLTSNCLRGQGTKPHPIKTISLDLGFGSYARPLENQNSRDHIIDHPRKGYERVRLWHRCVVWMTAHELICQHRGFNIRDVLKGHSKKGTYGHASSVWKLTMARPFHSTKGNQGHAAYRCDMHGCSNMMERNDVNQRALLVKNNLGRQEATQQG